MKITGNTKDLEEGLENVSLAEENNLENVSLVEENNVSFESISKLQKRISTAIGFDNSFESAMERVKDAQSNRILNYHRSKPIQNQETFETLLEEIGIMTDIEALEIEAKIKIAKKQKLLEEALSHVALLKKEKEDLQKTNDDLKEKTQDYRTLESRLDFQKRAAEKCFGELSKLNRLASNPCPYVDPAQIKNSFQNCDYFIRNQK